MNARRTTSIRRPLALLANLVVVGAGVALLTAGEAQAQARHRTVTRQP